MASKESQYLFTINAKQFLHFWKQWNKFKKKIAFPPEQLRKRDQPVRFIWHLYPNGEHMNDYDTIHFNLTKII